MKKTRTGLIGFGKTGKAVASVILQNTEFSLEWVLRRKHQLEHRSVPEYLGIESDEPGLIYSSQSIAVETLLDQHPVDVIIDFSGTDGIYSYGKLAAERGIRIISAISHYCQDEKNFLKQLAEKTAVFWSPNITLGVNFLLYASRFLRKIAPWADVEIIEEHFRQKDGISGTAIKIAEALNMEEQDIKSIRAGGIVGKHEVIFGFPNQTVRLIHESISREAFGNGAIFVAKNLAGKRPGFYRFEDILQPYFVA